MTYVNVGALSDNQRIKTKTALKRIVKESPELVRFDQTSDKAYNGLPRIITLESLTPSFQLSVIGPDPYTARNWYATVQMNRNGRWTVS